MGDPELYSDEHILLRTQGIIINSIAFEGILTNKRIILTDKAANLLPRILIPLMLLRNVEAEGDAIGDQIIRLTLQATASETREMILTFSCTTPTTGNKERDAWVRILKWLRILKENASLLCPEEEIQNVIPEHEPVSPWIEEMRPPMPDYVPVIIKTTVKKEVTWTPSTEWSNALSPSSSSRTITTVHDVSPSGSGTYSYPEKEFNNLIFGVIFLILIIICPMIMSITSTLNAQDSLSGMSIPDRISAPAPLAVSPPPDLPKTGSILNLIPTHVPPGNSAKALSDAPLVATGAKPPVAEKISPYVTIEPKPSPYMERHVALQPSITQKYGKDYVTIYSLTDQNVSQVLPLVSFTLHNPPLVIDYNITPLTQVRIKHLEYKVVDTYYEKNLEMNRPYEGSWFRIIVRNKDTGDVISEDGFGGNYSFQTPKQLVVRECGNYSFEFTGGYGVLDLTMKVRQEGNFL